MGNSVCSVRDNHCCCSVHNGAGSRTSGDQKFDQERGLPRSQCAGTAVGSERLSCCADGCLPSDGRARSESVSASCTMVVWALSIGLIELPLSHWAHVTCKQERFSKSEDRARPLRKQRDSRSVLSVLCHVSFDLYPTYQARDCCSS